MSAFDWYRARVQPRSAWHNCKPILFMKLTINYRFLNPSATWQRLIEKQLKGLERLAAILNIPPLELLSDKEPVIYFSDTGIPPSTSGKEDHWKEIIENTRQLYGQVICGKDDKIAFLENEKPAAKDKNKDKGPQAVAFIPKGAVRSDANASFVFLIRDGKVERRAVNLGLDRGTDVAVLAGVTPGDSLVVKGPENLHDGDKVEIRQ